MPTILILIVLAFGGAVFYEVSRPVEVKNAVYALEGTRLNLVRQSLINLDGRYEWKSLAFTETVFLATVADGEGQVVDHLRGEPFLCGSRPCNFTNPIAKELSAVSAKLQTARLILTSTSDALNSAEVKRISTVTLFAESDCKSKLAAQPPQKHPMACEPGSERAAAEGLCLVATLGPDACAKYVGDEIFSKIAASEACSTAAAALLNESRSGSEREVDAMFGLISHASSEVLKSAKEGNIFAWLLTPYAAVVKVVEIQRKVESFNGCLPKATQRCSSAYQEWKAQLSAFEEQFGPSIARCGELEVKLKSLQDEIENGKRYQAELQTAVVDFEEATAELRSKEITVTFN